MATEPIATDRHPARRTLRRTRRSHGSAAWRPGTTLGAVPLALFVACTSDDAGTGSFAEGCILNTAAVCDDCLELEHEFRIGSVAGSGFISGRGGEDQIVRDGSGNYWLGQREYMNVYGPGGEFIRTVGREGEGPMEFQYGRPFHADAAGNVHIWDFSNSRVSIITPDFELVDEKPLSGQQINDLLAIDDGDLQVLQTWFGNPSNPGQPIHIVDGREVLSSFGEEYLPGDDPSDFNPLDTRFLAAAPNGAIMAAHREEYRIESWSRDGELLGSLAGPDLENAPFEPGPVTPENPFPNLLSDMHVDASGRVWVSLLLRRPDWVENSEEDPEGGLMPVDMDMLNWFRGRVDLIDVATCTLLASHVQDPFFLDFIEDGLVADVEFSPEGAPLINVSRIRLGDGTRVGDEGSQRPDAADAGAGTEATERVARSGATVGAQEDEAPAGDESPSTGWTVELDIDEDHPEEQTDRYAWSPWADEPAPLGTVDGDFRSRIWYRCLNAAEREVGNTDSPIRVRFAAPPRLVGGEELELGGASERLQVSADWGSETVVLNAYAVPRAWWMYLEQDDAAERATGESSDAEFKRRLLESGSSGLDVVRLDLEWEEVGQVTYTYSLEGAADAIREAGSPCGIE